MATAKHRQKLLSDAGAELAPDIAPLSPRQAEATWHAFEGLTAAQTAAAMRCQVRTVISHLQSSMDKLGAMNKTHLVAIAVRKGIINIKLAGFASVRLLATLTVGSALYIMLVGQFMAPNDLDFLRPRPRPVRTRLRKEGE